MGQIARTRPELAKALGLKSKDPQRQISRWEQQDGFPGRAGKAGRQDGHYPVDEIAAWIDANTGQAIPDTEDADVVAAKRRVALLEWERKELDALEKLGQLADVDELGQFLAIVTGNTKAIIGALPEKLLESLPASLSEDVRADIYSKAEEIVDSACLEIERYILGDDDPTDDNEEDSNGQSLAEADSGD